jgi:hypothetical protein
MTMRILFTLFLVCISFINNANSITVGDTEIKIPNPTNYSAVSSDMKALFEFQKQFVGKTNDEFISFILSTDTGIALQNEIPDLERRFSVQTTKDLVNRTVPISDFRELKEIVKNQNNEIIKKAENVIKEQFMDINSNISEKQKVDLALSVSNISPLPVHIETERSLAYSVYVKYNINDEAGMPSTYISITTATFIYLKGKILFLYSFAGESDLEWSQKISKEWANSVIDANPLDFSSKVKELLPASISGINWEQVGIKGLVGALIGLLVGLFSWLYNRRKAS